MIDRSRFPSRPMWDNHIGPAEGFGRVGASFCVIRVWARF